MPGRPLPRRRLVALSLLAACPLFLAACGDDSTESSAADTTATTAPAAGGLSVNVVPATAAPGATVEASVVNDTDKQFTYGAAYELEHEVAGSFEKVDLPPTPVIEIGYVAPPGETGPALEAKLPADLASGTYRVIVMRDVPDVGDLAGEFEVSDGA